MDSIDYKKKAAFDIISALKDLESLSLVFPEIKNTSFYKSAIVKLQLIKDEDNTYLLGKYYEQYTNNKL